MSSGDPYSHQAPRIRPQYMPAAQEYYSSPPPIGSYYPPPPSYTPLRSQPLPDDNRGRSRQQSYEYSDDEYSHAPQSHRSSRPKPVTRRSSSHPGYSNRQEVQRSSRPVSNGRSPRESYDDYSDSEDDRRERGSQQSQKPMHPNLTDHFTDSPTGLGASAVGVFVGGWVARKAQDQAGHDKKGSGSAFLTILGAAAGGLVANAVVDRIEEKRQRTEAKRDMKWDGGRQDDERTRKGSEKSGRRRRDSWEDERY